VQARLCENEQLRPNISLIVDGSVSQQRLRHKLREDSEIHFLPSISGGWKT
jgi:sulfur-carrier protein